MENNKELISVIMSVYNEKADWLKESVNSILQQTYKNIEFVIVVDNPKNTCLIDILKEYEKADNRIILKINEENKGLVHSLNRALEYCTGQYIARMDADDISHLDRFEKQLSYIKSNKLDLIGTNVHLFKDNKHVFFTTDKLLTHKYLKKLLLRGAIGIVHPTFFGKREVFETLNGYEYSPHTEDMEFLARVITNGFKVGNMKDVLLDCRYSDGSITKSNAIYIYKMALYITKLFNEFNKNGKYQFDKRYYETIEVSDKEIANYSKNKILLGQAREEFNNKNYVRFIYHMTKALLTSSSILLNIKLNLFLQYYRFLEKNPKYFN